MDQIKSIVVGMDFSQCSRAALHTALRVSKWNDASLHIVHVVEHSAINELIQALGGRSADVHASAIHGAQRAWQEFIADIPEATSLPFVALIGHPVTALVQAAHLHDADLLVMGTHGFSSKSGAGTVAAACIRRASCTVLLVKDPHHGPFRVVLACIDFSESSRKALAQAARFASHDQARLRILHVFDGPWHKLHYRGETTDSSLKHQIQYRAGLEQRLREFCETGNDEIHQLAPRYDVFDYASHGEGICTFANEHAIDLIVLGTHGRTNLRDLLLGGAAERALRETPCSILIVRRTDES